MLRRPFFIFIITLLMSGTARAQDPAVSWRSTAKTAVFLELGGNAGYYSYNIDRRLNERVTGRFAYGNYDTIELGDQPTKTYQAFLGMINTLVGGPVVWMELGLGGLVGSYANKRMPADNWQFPRYPIRAITSTVGIRRQPALGGFVFRMGVMPQYNFHRDNGEAGYSLRFGLSVGLAF
jgi:hypothetical protein